MRLNMSEIIGLVLSLIITGLLVPTGILYLYIGQFVNVTVGGVTYTFGDVVDPVITTLFTVILPIVIMVSIMIKYVPRSN